MIAFKIKKIIILFVLIFIFITDILFCMQPPTEEYLIFNIK